MSVKTAELRKNEDEAMGNSLPKLGSYHRIVVKIGSALLVDRGSGLKRDWLESLGADVAALIASGVEVMIVSSGAIALGRTVLGLPKGALRLRKARLPPLPGRSNSPRPMLKF